MTPTPPEAARAEDLRFARDQFSEARSELNM